MAFSFRAGTNWYHDFPKLARDSGFYFNMHRSKVRVDWNRIGGIDIDRVLQERDFSTIDENINNVVDYHLESEYDVKILDPNFVKLFRLAQLSVEYLLYCKQYLDHSVVILKDELRSKVEENVKLKKELASADEDLNLLKDKLKDKFKIFEKKFNDSQGEVHRCPYCPKTFMSAIFTNSHICRRHSNSSQLPFSSPVHDQYKIEAEKMQDEIKNLKERLNQTERVIKNESEKLSESMESKGRSNGNQTADTTKNEIEKDRTFEEEHKKYREEMSNLTAMLFSEIKNLREDDKKTNQLDNENEDWKELLKQQENEIQRLRDQVRDLSLKKSTPDIEMIELKLNNQDEYWQSKIDQIESQHTRDIEELSTQLKITQEAAERIRNDYINKMKELEEKSKNDGESVLTAFRSPSASTRHKEREKHHEKNSITKTEENTKKFSHGIDDIFDDNDKISEEEMPISSTPVNNNHHRIKVHSADLDRNTEDSLHNSQRKFNSKSDSEDSQRKYTQNEMKRKRWSVNAEVMTDEKRTNYRMQKRNLQNDKRLMDKRNVEVENNKSKKTKMKMDISSSQSDDSESESETLSESEDSVTNSSEESQSIDDQDLFSQEITESDQDKPHLGSKVQIKKKEELKEELQNDLEQKLADLGINPEIDGIPKSTYQRLINIVKHHRSISSRKYKSFEEIRRNIINRINQKFSNQEKNIRKLQVPDTPKKLPPNKSISNVKTKAVKTLSVQPVQGVHTPKIKSKRVSSAKQSLNGQNFELLPKKITQRDFQDVKTVQPKSLRSKEDRDEKKRLSLNNEGYSPSPRRIHIETKQQENADSKNVHKSLKGKSKGQMSTFISLKEELKNVLSGHIAMSNASSSIVKADDINSLPTSPKENKSVLKSAPGSMNFGKKKVLFDLETTKEMLQNLSKEEEREGKEHMYPQSLQRNDKDDSEDDDFDISSIIDEESKDSSNEKPANSEKIMKTLNLDNNAKITRMIEQQLNSNRSKSKGDVFIEEFDLYENDKSVEQLVKRSTETVFNGNIVDIHKKSGKLPQPAPRTTKGYSASSGSKSTRRNSISS